MTILAAAPRGEDSRSGGPVLPATGPGRATVPLLGTALAVLVGSVVLAVTLGPADVGPADVWLGEIDGCDFYIAKDQFETWKHTELTIDVVPGRGASFSLEIPMGVRFVTKSKLFCLKDDEKLVETRRGDMI